MLGLFLFLSCSDEAAPTPGDEPTCEGSLVACEGSCVDLDSDALHCGRCNGPCAEGQVCSDGSCAPACDEGLERCGGECVDPLRDTTNCGGCGIVCGASEVCIDGACEELCSDGGMLCGYACVDISTDRMHCGTCNQACADHLLCQNAECTCPEGGEDCDGSCVDLDSDLAHCGACNQGCHGLDRVEEASCEAGACVVVRCEEGWEDCDGDPANGCEAELASDPKHCGGCGTDCLAFSNVGDGLCIEGSCEIAECAPGWADCDLDAANGCEIHVETDVLNCGECDNSCIGLPNNEADAACFEGGCALDCATDWEDCDGVSSNGCEAHLPSDRLHCGACNVTCTFCDEGACESVVQLQSGNMYTCSLWESGMVSCWGGDASSWSGEPSMPPSASPVRLAGPTDAKLLARGPGTLNCALNEDDEVWCWGAASGLVSEPESSHVLPLRVEGLPEDQQVVDLVVSSEAACAHLANEEVWCWGNSEKLGHEGEGDPEYLPPAPITGFDSEVVELSAGWANFCARTTKGDVWCWGARIIGENFFTMTPVPERVPGLSGATSLGVGNLLSMCAVTEAGVRCWGINDQMQLGSEDPMAGRLEPTTVAGLSDVRSVGTGASHSCALTREGEVYCWGGNNSGELGREGERSATPVKIENLEDVVELSVGGSHTCVRRADRQILCWGANDFGQLGRGFSGPSDTFHALVEFDF